MPLSATYRHAAIVALLIAGFNAPAAADQPAAPIKVGVIGMDNYQCVAFARLFDTAQPPSELAGLRVVAGYPIANPDLKESVENLPKWIERFQKSGIRIVDSTDALLAQVDVVLLMSLDGRKHLQQVRPVLKAGKPVYIGRPLSASLDDALEIFRLAKEHNCPIFSCSQHRFSPGFIGMRDHPEVGRVLGCDVHGGCPLVSHHPDLFWHGVHGIETLYTIMGPGCVSVTRASNDDFELITGVWRDGRIGTYRGLRKGAIRYSALVYGDKGIAPAGQYGHPAPVNGVVPKSRYMGYEGVAVEIARFFKTRRPPVSAAETIEIFTFMEAAHESKRQGGKPVKLADVLRAAQQRAAAE